MAEGFDMKDDILKVLLSEEEIAAKVQEIGAQISKDYADKNLLLVSVLKGSVVFMADLMRAITVNAAIDFMSVSSYGSGVKTSGEVKIIKDLDEPLEGKNVIIATGAYSRPIGCKGEAEFMGKGVSYCATCDANFFEDFEVYVVGGGDSAVEEAMYLTKFARKVTIIHRRNELRAAKSIQEKAFANPKIDFFWDSVVEEVYGDDILQGMIVKNVKTGETRKVEADPEDGMFGLFGFIGTVPNSKLFEGIIDMDERGYIKTDEDMHTNIPGVYAAGDVRIKSLRQVVTAAADGAIAAVQVERSMSDYF